MKKIVFTGGGTAGHVIPAIALFDELKNMSYEIYYIGSYEGIEKSLIKEQNIPYYPISTGKLRRYFDFQNFTDPFRIIRGILQAKKILKRINPDLIFSKGGFVAVPVTIAASLLKIPIILHESDFTPGLANKIVLRFADKILVTFPETLKYLPEDKATLTGTPIRNSILEGHKDKAKSLLNFDDKPVVMIMGGSSGSVVINKNVRKALSSLIKKYNIIHLCGKGNLSEEHENLNGYKQFEFVTDELADLFSITDVMVSRSGANTLYEILALKKPNLLIPLSLRASRGDQILNAKSFEKNGFSKVLEEENLTVETLINSINCVYENKDKYLEAMQNSKLKNSNRVVIDVINQYLDS
jgi:UDP-N-acetylglucosamine--N-acetylmuramyl-(pentapeptide) pyrophosphoryl-undecaprenol N-acetylglucosamine transferase